MSKYVTKTQQSQPPSEKKVRADSCWCILLYLLPTEINYLLLFQTYFAHLNSIYRSSLSIFRLSVNKTFKGSANSEGFIHWGPWVSRPKLKAINSPAVKITWTKLMDQLGDIAFQRVMLLVYLKKYNIYNHICDVWINNMLEEVREWLIYGTNVKFFIFNDSMVVTTLKQVWQINLR